MVVRNFYHIATPLSPGKGGKQEKSSSLPGTRGGLGWGQKYLIHQPELFKHPLNWRELLTGNRKNVRY